MSNNTEVPEIFYCQWQSSVSQICSTYAAVKLCCCARRRTWNNVTILRLGLTDQPSVRDSPDDLLILGPMVTGHAGATDGRDRRACHLNRRAPRKPRWQAWSTESGFPPCLTLGNWRRGGVHQQRPTLPVAPSCSEMAPPSGANAS